MVIFFFLLAKLNVLHSHDFLQTNYSLLLFLWKIEIENNIKFSIPNLRGRRLRVLVLLPRVP